MEAKDFLEELDYYNTNVDGEQFEDLGIETLADMLEVYHQKKLKLLGLGVVSYCTTCNDEINYKGVCEICYTKL